MRVKIYRSILLRFDNINETYLLRFDEARAPPPLMLNIRAVRDTPTILHLRKGLKGQETDDGKGKQYRKA